jgi:hypothetical protein
MEEEEMGTTRKSAQRRLLRALTTTVVLALLAALLLAGTALAATPGKPTAKTPKGAITTSTPTFKWSKAAGAVKYELRTYKGSKLLLKKTGLTKLSWKSSKALPKNVNLTWKVRASNASGNGAWSKRLTFKVITLSIGVSYGGGKVAYILQSGDPGYVPGQKHGLIAAASDQSSGIQWYNGADSTTGATATALGTGLANTDTIIAVQGPNQTSYAAGLARAYSGGGHADWYLPSRDELNELYLGRAAIGGFEAANYWSSSEGDAKYALFQDFSNGAQGGGGKAAPMRVRAVRNF